MDETSLRVMQLAAQGFCCSQIMIQLTLDDMGEENIGLVRAAAGLCDGLGIGDLCGVASGGACIIALYAAKGSGEENALDAYPLLLSEFMDWFKANSCSDQQNPVTRCDDILAATGGKNVESCGNLMLQARQMILQLLTDHDIDPSLPREQAGEY